MYQLRKQCILRHRSQRGKCNRFPLHYRRLSSSSRGMLCTFRWNLPRLSPSMCLPHTRCMLPSQFHSCTYQRYRRCIRHRLGQCTQSCRCICQYCCCLHLSAYTQGILCTYCALHQEIHRRTYLPHTGCRHSFRVCSCTYRRHTRHMWSDWSHPLPRWPCRPGRVCSRPIHRLSTTQAHTTRSTLSPW